MTNNTKSNSNDVESKLENWFNTNSKFFSVGDIAGKKAFFSLGMYTRKVLEALEKEVATSGTETPEQSKFVKRINREISYNMNYRAFTVISKLLDPMARSVNPKLFMTCSGVCKQYIINSDAITNKKALPAADANLAFSLGMFQK